MVKPKKEAAAGSTKRKSKSAPKATFEMLAPTAGAVAIASSFDEWQMHPMERDAEGLWRIALDLKPGRHEYRFIIDGNWCEDPANPDHVTNSFGGLNSIRVIE